MASLLVMLFVVSATAFFTACGAPAQLVHLRLDSAAGTAPPRSLVRAVPVRTSAMPLPVSLDNLTQAMGAGGDSGVTDEDGRVTLRLMPGHPHLVVVAPMPFALPVPEGVEPPVWNWRLEPDFRTILPWHTDTASTKAASATEHAPTLLVER